MANGTPGQSVKPYAPLVSVVTAAALAVTNASLVAGSLQAVTLTDLGVSTVIRLKAIKAKFSTVAGGATALVLQVFEDSAGDVPATAQTSTTITNLWTGLTTATSGQVVVLPDTFIKVPTSGVLHVGARTTGGTMTLTSIELIYEPN